MFNFKFWGSEKETEEEIETSNKEQDWTLIDALEKIIDIAKH